MTQGYLTGKKLYLSSPTVCKNLPIRHILAQQLREKFKLEVTDPFEDIKQTLYDELAAANEISDFNTVERIATMFVRKDLALVDEHKIILAILPKDANTVGVHHELINSWNLKKPTLIMCPEGLNKINCWYRGFFDQEFLHGSWESVVDYFYNVDQGKATHKRWDLIYGKI